MTYLDPRDNEDNNMPNPPAKTQPTWSMLFAIVVTMCFAFYVYHKESSPSSPSEVVVVERKPDAAVVRLGLESATAAKLAPYNALKKAANIELDSTAKYATFIHENLNSSLDQAWAAWAKEMTARFGETSDTQLSPTKQREIRDYFSDLADGVKQAK